MDTFNFLPTIFIENPRVPNDIIHFLKNIAGDVEVWETIAARAAITGSIALSREPGNKRR